MQRTDGVVKPVPVEVRREQAVGQSTQDGRRLGGTAWCSSPRSVARRCARSASRPSVTRTATREAEASSVSRDRTARGATWDRMRIAAMLDRPPFPELMAAFIDAAERDPALAGLQASLTQRRREPLLRVVLEAARRGALPADVDRELVVDLLAAPFFYRRFVAHRPIPADMPKVVVDHVLTALRPDPR
jgi:hypothetical protein